MEEPLGYVKPAKFCLQKIIDPKNKLIIFGDSYENLHAVNFLTKINKFFCQAYKTDVLHVVLEIFSFEMQFILDEFMTG